MCGEIVGEADEYEIYTHVVENGPGALFNFICEDSENGALNSCSGNKAKDEL